MKKLLYKSLLILLIATFSLSPLYPVHQQSLAANGQCEIKNTATDNSTLEFSNLDTQFVYRVYITYGDVFGDANPSPETFTIKNNGDVFPYAFRSALKNREYNIQLLAYSADATGINNAKKAAYNASSGQIEPEYNGNRSCGNAFELNKSNNDPTPEPSDTTCKLLKFSADKSSAALNEDVKLTITTEGCSDKFVQLSATIEDCSSQAVIGQIDGIQAGGYSLHNNIANPTVSFGQNGSWKISLFLTEDTEPIPGNAPINITITESDGNATATCGGEKITIDPSEGIEEGEDFKINLSGLDEEKCYYLQIESPNGNIDPKINKILDPSTITDHCDGISEKPVFAGGVRGQFGKASQVSVPADLANDNGMYIVYLYEAKKRAALTSFISDHLGKSSIIGGILGSKILLVANPSAYIQYQIANRLSRKISSAKDQVVAAFPLCIGGEIANDSCEPPPPPGPPCIKGLDAEGNIVDIAETREALVMAYQENSLTDDEKRKQIIELKKTLREEQKKLVTCTMVATAVGPIGTDPGTFITSILALLLSISGGIALLLIIRSGYQMMTSQGNPELIQEARERITSAIVGLLFIIFSLVILQVIGVDILKIPGFGN